MTLTFSLTPELELYLKQKSEQQGISIEAYILQILTEQASLGEKQVKVVNLLQSWLDEDAEEQRDGRIFNSGP